MEKAIAGLKTEINVLNLKMLKIPKPAKRRQKNHSKKVIAVLSINILLFLQDYHKHQRKN